MTGALLLGATLAHNASAQHPQRAQAAEAAQAAQAATSTAALDWSAFDKYVAQAARDWHVPALAIAVVKDDSLVFAKGYGVLQVGTDKRADEHTRFAIGSTTKAMTSTALAMLVDEGKLRWDDRVAKYIPELELYDPYVTRELTVRDLLTHRTGLPGTDLLWYQWHYSTPEIIRRLRFVKPESSFRSNWEYQNVMYSLGGTIVERVSGMPWDAFIRQRIFAPLGMNESETTVAAIAGKPNVAVPHYEIRDTVRVAAVRSTDAIAPAGSVWSSVSDMSKWMRFILDSGRVGSKQLVKPATFRELIAPQIRAPLDEYPALQLAKPSFFSYGLGWFIQDYRERPVWMHTGSIDGMCAIIGLLPNEHVGVYVLENLDHAEVRHALMYSVFDLYAGGSTRDWSADLHGLFDKARAARTSHMATAQQPAGKPSLPLDQYAGTYADSTYGNVVVAFANGKLTAQIVTDPVRELEPVTFDSFRTQSSNPNEAIEVTFLPNGTGGLAGLQIEGVTFGKVRATRAGESR
jgi:CubicO group peptidase (beta-lactamase class C family)